MEKDTIINLGFLLSKHAEKPVKTELYIDELQAFIRTLNYYYIPKPKIENKLEELKNEMLETENINTFEKLKYCRSILKELKGE